MPGVFVDGPEDLEILGFISVGMVLGVVLGMAVRCGYGYVSGVTELWGEGREKGPKGKIAPKKFIQKKVERYRQNKIVKKAKFHNMSQIIKKIK